jgi:hypothetical protein
MDPNVPPLSLSGYPNQRTEVIPLCWYVNEQPVKSHGFVACNYACYDGRSTSKHFEYGTICPRLIPRFD